MANHSIPCYLVDPERRTVEVNMGDWPDYGDDLVHEYEMGVRLDGRAADPPVRVYPQDGAATRFLTDGPPPHLPPGMPYFTIAGYEPRPIVGPARLVGIGPDHRDAAPPLPLAELRPRLVFSVAP